jgi:hypothetical protein
MSRREVGGGWKTAGDLDWRMLGTVGERQLGNKGNTVSGIQNSMKVQKITNVSYEPRDFYKFKAYIAGTVKVKTIDRSSYDADGYGHICKSGTRYSVEGWVSLYDVVWAMRQARKYSGNYTQYYVAYNGISFAVGYCVYQDDSLGGYDERHEVGLLKTSDRYGNFNDDFPTDSMRLMDLRDIKTRTFS